MCANIKVTDIDVERKASGPATVYTAYIRQLAIEMEPYNIVVIIPPPDILVFGKTELGDGPLLRTYGEFGRPRGGKY